MLLFAVNFVSCMIRERQTASWRYDVWPARATIEHARVTTQPSSCARGRNTQSNTNADFEVDGPMDVHNFNIVCRERFHLKIVFPFENIKSAFQAFK